jgi:hypothetical protein
MHYPSSRDFRLPLGPPRTPGRFELCPTRGAGFVCDELLYRECLTLAPVARVIGVRYIAKFYRVCVCKPVAADLWSARVLTGDVGCRGELGRLWPKLSRSRFDVLKSPFRERTGSVLDPPSHGLLSPARLDLRRRLTS